MKIPSHFCGIEDDPGPDVAEAMSLEIRKNEIAREIKQRYAKAISDAFTSNRSRAASVDTKPKPFAFSASQKNNASDCGI